MRQRDRNLFDTTIESHQGTYGTFINSSEELWTDACSLLQSSPPHSVRPLSSGYRTRHPRRVQGGEMLGSQRAGKHDCASTSYNSCCGTSKVNAYPKAWIYVSARY